MAGSSDTTPKGQRYSLQYCPQPEEQTDSVQFRRRLGMIIDTVQERDVEQFSLRWERATGIPRFVDGQPTLDDRWMYDLEQVPLHVVLDTITIAYEYIAEGPSAFKVKRRKDYLSEVRKVLSEERILFFVDDKGGVHPKIDVAFEVQRTSVIQGMASSRYETANRFVDRIDEALMKDPPDGTAAIRSVFDAAENIFKMMFAGPQKLAGRELRATLRIWIQKEYASGHPADVVAMKFCESFCRWVDAAHFYRHQRGHPKPHQPPHDLTILMVSQGLGYIRWLVEMDQKMLANAPDTGAATR